MRVGAAALLRLNRAMSKHRRTQQKGYAKRILVILVDELHYPTVFSGVSGLPERSTGFWNEFLPPPDMSGRQCSGRRLRKDQMPFRNEFRVRRIETSN
jgi:hypothetical protein